VLKCQRPPQTCRSLSGSVTHRKSHRKHDVGITDRPSSALTCPINSIHEKNSHQRAITDARCVLIDTEWNPVFHNAWRHKDRVRAHLPDELAQLTARQHTTKKYSMPLDEGRPERLPPSQPPEPNERNLPSASSEEPEQPAERQKQWLGQGQKVARSRRPPVRHGHLSFLQCTPPINPSRHVRLIGLHIFLPFLSN
jgi:hypothetical protein